MNGYRCIACDQWQGPAYSGYVCPACGGNLDVCYDYEAAAAAMDGIFDAEALLPVHSPPAPLRIGGTPLLAARRLGAATGLSRLYLKDDSANPSASLKDRASSLVVRRALDLGVKTVAAASTGNAGSSLACVAAAAGLDAVVFVPADAPQAKLAQLQVFGATVLAVRGNYDEAFDLCLAASAEFGWLNRSTGYNPFTREGKKTCAYEIWNDLGGAVPDRIIVPAGDGNILSGLWKGWRDLRALGLVDRLPGIDAVQSAGSAAICNAIARLRAAGGSPDWREVGIDPVQASTVADSLAVNHPRDGLAAVRAVIESGGDAIVVADEDILGAIPEIARATGVFAEPAAAASWAGLRQLCAAGKTDSDALVVCLVTGSGLKDVASVQATCPPPREIEPSLDAVREALGR